MRTDFPFKFTQDVWSTDVLLISDVCYFSRVGLARDSIQARKSRLEFPNMSSIRRGPPYLRRLGKIAGQMLPGIVGGCCWPGLVHDKWNRQEVEKVNNGVDGRAGRRSCSFTWAIT